MNLYYTTASGYNEAQPNPSISLGGYKSSTLVGNDDLITCSMKFLSCLFVVDVMSIGLLSFVMIL